VLVWNELYECSTDADLKLRNMFELNPFDQNQCKVSNFLNSNLILTVNNLLLLYLILAHTKPDVGRYLQIKILPTFKLLITIFIYSYVQFIHIKFMCNWHIL